MKKLIVFAFVFTVLGSAAPKKKAHHPDLLVKGTKGVVKLLYKGARVIL